MTIDFTNLLKIAKNCPLPVLLAIIAVGIVAAIMKHKDVVIVLPLVGILALIVLFLIFGPFRRRRR